MLVCSTRKGSQLMVKRELENLKLIYEIRNQEGCTVIHWKIKFYSEVPIGFILLTLWKPFLHSSKLSYLGRIMQVSPATRPASAGNAKQCKSRAEEIVPRAIHVPRRNTNYLQAQKTRSAYFR